VLATGTHQYRFFANDSSGNENATPISYFTVSKASATATLYLNSTVANITSVYPNSSINVTAVSSIAGLYVQLWRNGTLINNGTSNVINNTQWAAYPNNFTAQVLGNQNYTDSMPVTLWWNVSKGSTLTRLFFNGTEGNRNYNISDIVNLTATTNISALTVTLYANYSGSLFSIGNNIGIVTNYTNATNLALTTYLVKSNTTDNENYTSSQVNYTFTVVDLIPPKYSNNSTNNTVAGQPTLFSLNWTDNYGLHGYIFSTNNTGTWINDSFHYFGEVNENSTDWSVGLVGLWHMNEGSNSVTIDSSVNSNTGSLQNMNETGNNMNGSIPSGWTAGVFGNALGFDGANDRVNVGNASNLNVVNLTIGAWIKVNKISQMSIGGKFAGTGNNRSYGISTDSSGNIELTIYNGSYALGLGSGGLATITANRWYFVTVTFSPPNSTKFYINGSFITETIYRVNQIYASASPLQIGWVSDVLYHFNGTIEEFMVWNRTLSATEIQQIYNLSSRLPTQSWSNITKTLNTTTGSLVQWRVYANDTSNNWNASEIFYLTTSDNLAPTYTNNQSQTVTVYSPTNYSNFSITWNDNSGSLYGAYLENNFSGTLKNSSMTGPYPYYYYNSSALPAGSYQYRFFANDSSGNTNYTPDIKYFTIAKVAPTGIQSFNPEQNVEYPTQTIVSCSLTTGDTGTTLTLKRDAVTVSTGTSPSETNTLGYAAAGYSYTCEYPSTQNY
jgi:hypothetical protein